MKRLLLFSMLLLSVLPFAQAKFVIDKWWEADSLNLLKYGDTIQLAHEYIDTTTLKVYYRYLTIWNNEIVEVSNPNEGRWILSKEGHKSTVEDLPLFYLQHVETGLYLNGMNNFTPDKGSAWKYILLPASKVVGDYESQLKAQNPCLNSVGSYSRLESDSSETKSIHYLYADSMCYIMKARKFSTEYELLDSLMEYKSDKYIQLRYVAGEGPGQIPQDLYNALCEAFTYAKNLTTDNAEVTEDECRKARERFEDLIARADSICIRVPDGYYRLRNSGSDHDMYLFSDGSEVLKSVSVYKSHPLEQQVFHVVRNAQSGSYTLRSMYDSMYIGRAYKMFETIPMVQKANDAEYYIQKSAPDYLLIADENQKGFTAHFTLQRKDSMRVAWQYGSGSGWLFIPVEQHVVDSLQEIVRQHWLDNRLQSLIAQARKALGRATGPQAARSEVRPCITALSEAVSRAQSVEEGLAEEQNIRALNTAYVNFMAVWPDSTDLAALLAQSRDLLATAAGGTAIGQYPTPSIERLTAHTGNVEALLPFCLLGKAETDSATALLREEIALMQGSMNVPQNIMSYFIVSNATGTNNYPGHYEGACLRFDSYNSIEDASVSSSGTILTNEQNARGAWLFVRLDGDNRYAIQNLATGGYLFESSAGRLTSAATPTPFRFVALGGGHMGLQSISSSKYLLKNGHYARTGNHDTGYLDSWLFVPTDDDRITDIKEFLPGTACVIAVPYAMTQLPVTNDNVSLNFYTVCGADRNSNGNISAIRLSLVRDGALEPGTPYVMVTGTAPGVSTVNVDMCLDYLNPRLVTTLTTANGLVGTYNSLTVNQPGYAVFRERRLLPTGYGIEEEVNAQYGYIDAYAVRNLPSTTTDLVLYVEDGSEIISHSAPVTAAAENRPVNVYTPDGVLLRRNVSRAEATRGLQPGLYIVGRRKVMIRP